MNVSKPVFVSVILSSMFSAMMISQVFNAIAADGGGNPFAAVWEAIEDLQSQIDEIPGGFGAPDYDSGWIALNPGQSVTLEHNLGTRELFVYLVGLNDFDAVHQFGHGGDSYLEEGAYTKWGAQWMLPSDNTIFVLRLNEDLWWLEIRVYIWVIP